MHTSRTGCFHPGAPGLAEMHTAIIPLFERKDSWFLSVVEDDGGTEPDGGAPFRSSLARIPFQEEGSADHFSEICPLNGLRVLGQNNCTAHATSKLT